MKIWDVGILAASIFHAIVGVTCLTILSIDLRLIHIGLLGIVSLAAAYGLFRRRPWTLWCVFTLSFMATAFTLSMIYYTMGTDILVDAEMAAYLVLTWFFAIYAASKRKRLEF